MIHLWEVSQILDDSFTRGQSPISVTGHWRILSNVADSHSVGYSKVGYVFMWRPESKLRTEGIRIAKGLGWDWKVLADG